MNASRLKFFVGLNTGYVAEGKPDERFVEFYRRRSSSALHCAIVGNVVIPGGHPCNESTPTISRTPEWAAVASKIARRGSLPGIQLHWSCSHWHCQSFGEFHKKFKYSVTLAY